MLIVDNNGHTYAPYHTTIDSDWESLDIPFVTWFEPARLSTDLLYTLPIRVLSIYDTVTISMGTSEVFAIVPDWMFENGNGITGNFHQIKWGEQWSAYDLSGNFFNSEVTINTQSNLCMPVVVNEGTLEERELNMFTFYIMASYNLEETILKNIAIIESNGSTPIDYGLLRVGATFYDQSEELNILGSNQGIELPADICKAFWECDFNEYYPDNAQHRDKMKELLWNYMGIKGECGNMSSAIKSLKWFGWGDHIQMSQFVKLNETIRQLYLNDYFDISTDISSKFLDYRKTTFVSLKTWLREALNLLPKHVPGETEGTYSEESAEPLYDNYAEDGIDWTDNPLIFGEDSVFDRHKNDLFDDSTKLARFEQQYHYVMNDLAIKISCLSRMYEQYFLPVHLNVMSASVVESVTMAPLKMLCGSATHECVHINTVSTQDDVVFNRYQYKVDQNSQYSLEYFVDYDFTIIPADIDTDFITYQLYLYVNTEEDAQCVYVYHGGYSISDARVTDEDTKEWDTEKLRRIHRINVDDLFKCGNKYTHFDVVDINHAAILFNGAWFEQDVIIKYPEFKLEVGKLEYEYVDTVDVEENGETFDLADMHEENLVLTRQYNRYVSERKSVAHPKEMHLLQASLVNKLERQNIAIPDTQKNVAFTVTLNEDTIGAENYRKLNLKAGKLTDAKLDIVSRQLLHDTIFNIIYKGLDGEPYGISSDTPDIYDQIYDKEIPYSTKQDTLTDWLCNNGKYALNYTTEDDGDADMSKYFDIRIMENKWCYLYQQNFVKNGDLLVDVKTEYKTHTCDIFNVIPAYDYYANASKPEYVLYKTSKIISEGPENTLKDIILSDVLANINILTWKDYIFYVEDERENNNYRLTYQLAPDSTIMPETVTLKPATLTNASRALLTPAIYQSTGIDVRYNYRRLWADNPGRPYILQDFYGNAEKIINLKWGHKYAAVTDPIQTNTEDNPVGPNIITNIYTNPITRDIIPVLPEIITKYEDLVLSNVTETVVDRSDNYCIVHLTINADSAVIIHDLCQEGSTVWWEQNSRIANNFVKLFYEKYHDILLRVPVRSVMPYDDQDEESIMEPHQKPLYIINEFIQSKKTNATPEFVQVKKQDDQYLPIVVRQSGKLNDDFVSILQDIPEVFSKVISALGAALKDNDYSDYTVDKLYNKVYTEENLERLSTLFDQVLPMFWYHYTDLTTEEQTIAELVTIYRGDVPEETKKTALKSLLQVWMDKLRTLVSSDTAYSTELSRLNNLRTYQKRVHKDIIARNCIITYIKALKDSPYTYCDGHIYEGESIVDTPISGEVRVLFPANYITGSRRRSWISEQLSTCDDIARPVLQSKQESQNIIYDPVQYTVLMTGENSSTPVNPIDTVDKQLDLLLSTFTARQEEDTEKLNSISESLVNFAEDFTSNVLSIMHDNITYRRDTIVSSVIRDFIIREHNALVQSGNVEVEVQDSKYRIIPNEYYLSIISKEPLKKLFVRTTGKLNVLRNGTIKEELENRNNELFSKLYVSSLSSSSIDAWLKDMMIIRIKFNDDVEVTLPPAKVNLKFLINRFKFTTQYDRTGKAINHFNADDLICVRASSRANDLPFISNAYHVDNDGEVYNEENLEQSSYGKFEFVSTSFNTVSYSNRLVETDDSDEYDTLKETDLAEIKKLIQQGELPEGSTGDYTDAFQKYAAEIKSIYRDNVDKSNYNYRTWLHNKSYLSLSIANYGLLTRTAPANSYLEPGYYDVTFSFTYSLAKQNMTVKYPGIIKVRDRISSNLYNDIYGFNKIFSDSTVVPIVEPAYTKPEAGHYNIYGPDYVYEESE